MISTKVTFTGIITFDETAFPFWNPLGYVGPTAPEPYFGKALRSAPTPQYGQPHSVTFGPTTQPSTPTSQQQELQRLIQTPQLINQIVNQPAPTGYKWVLVPENPSLIGGSNQPPSTYPTAAQLNEERRAKISVPPQAPQHTPQQHPTMPHDIPQTASQYKQKDK